MTAEISSSIRLVSQIRRTAFLLSFLALCCVVFEYATGVQMASFLVSQAPKTSPQTFLACVLALAATLRQRPLRLADRSERALWGGVIVLSLSFPMSGRLHELFWPDYELGVMAWNTAATLIAMAASQLLRARNRNLALACCGAALFFPCMGLNGYLLRQPIFFGQMAFTTVLTILPLAIANLARFSRHPWLATLLHRNRPGRLVRMQLQIWFVVAVGAPLLTRPDIVPFAQMYPLVHTIEMAVFFVLIVWFGQRFASLLHKSYRAESRMRRSLATDPLTGAATRKAAGEYFSELAGDMPIGLILFDIDHFKAINDGFGHEAGDRVLEAMVRVAQRTLRMGDLVARWGGEEFLVILRVADLDALHATSAKLQRAFSDLEVPGVSVTITASFGATIAFPSRMPELGHCIAQADRALYSAKQSGRNCVRLAFGRNIWDPQSMFFPSEQARIA